MVASRNRPKGARVGPFGLSVLALSLIPTQLGYQDIAALLIRQQDVSQRARAHALASPFGTIHAATFSFPRPVGTLIPELPHYQRASLNTGDVTGSIAPGAEPREVEFPVVNRRLKGDRLVSRPPEQPQPDGGRDLLPGRVKTVSFPRPEQNPAAIEPDADELRADVPAPPQSSNTEAAETTEAAEAPAVAPPQTYSLAALPPAMIELPAAAPEPLPREVELPPLEEIEAPDPLDHLDAPSRLARLYFGGLPVGRNIGTIERWPGDEPVLLSPPPADPEIKQTALAPFSPAHLDKGGETVAPKGEVTGPGKRPLTPAERLGLSPKERAKAEKCLAEAVYFESRGETKRGQIAVAQVVMNRVFSGYYPNNVCGVVYQNAHRYNACQFTFACDRIKDVVNEPDMWEQAKEIARDTMDGKLWLTDIGKSTHYHAYWVHPWWVGTMRKLSRIGVHTFYRPKRWGDGADAPAWGAGITPQNVKL